MSRTEVDGMLCGLGALWVLSLVVGCDAPAPMPDESTGGEATERTHKRAPYRPESPPGDPDRPDGPGPRPVDDITLADPEETPELECRRIGHVGEVAVCGPHEREDFDPFVDKDPDELEGEDFQPWPIDVDPPLWIGSGPCGDCLEAIAFARRARIDRDGRFTVAARPTDSPETRAETYVTDLLCRRDVGCVAFVKIARRPDVDRISQTRALASAAWTIEVTGSVRGVVESHALTTEAVYVRSAPRNEDQANDAIREEVASWTMDEPRVSGQEGENR